MTQTNIKLLLKNDLQQLIRINLKQKLSNKLNNKYKEILNMVGYKKAIHNQFIENMNMYGLEVKKITNISKIKGKYTIEQLQLKITKLKREVSLLNTLLESSNKFEAVYNKKVKEGQKYVNKQIENQIQSKTKLIKQLSSYTKLEVDMIIYNEIRNLFNDNYKMVNKLYAKHLSNLFGQQVFVKTRLISATKLVDKIEENHYNQSLEDIVINYFLSNYEFTFSLHISNEQQFTVYIQNNQIDKIDKQLLVTREYKKNTEFFSYLSRLATEFHYKNLNEEESKFVDSIISLYELDEEEIKMLEVITENRKKGFEHYFTEVKDFNEFLNPFNLQYKFNTLYSEKTGLNIDFNKSSKWV